MNVYSKSSSKKSSASSEVQLGLSWKPGPGPDRSKFVGWLRVALLHVDGLNPGIAELRKAVRVRTKGMGVRTLSTRRGRRQMNGSRKPLKTTAGFDADGGYSFTVDGRGRESAEFFAVPHVGSAVPEAMPQHASPSAITWPKGDPGMVQFLVCGMWTIALSLTMRATVLLIWCLVFSLLSCR